MAEIGNASQLTEGSDSEILYGPTGYGAAQSLGAALSGPVTYMPDSDLTRQHGLAPHRRLLAHRHRFEFQLELDLDHLDLDDQHDLSG